MNIYTAIKQGNLEEVKRHVNDGYDINIQTREYYVNPLLVAAYENQLEIVKFLVESGANVNVFDDIEQYSPLAYACRHYNFPMIKYLVEHGANLNDDRDSSILFALYDNSFHKDINDYLYIFDYLLEKGADINITNRYEETLVHVMCDNILEQTEYRSKYISEYKFLKYLIKNGADVNKDGKHHTPLDVACCSRNIDMAKLIISKGAFLFLKSSISSKPEVLKSINIDELLPRQKWINKDSDTRTLILTMRFVTLWAKEYLPHNKNRNIAITELPIDMIKLVRNMLI